LGVTILTFEATWSDVICHVTIGVAIWVSYRWSIWTDRLSRTFFAILSFKGNGVMTLTFRVTWCHRSCDHWIPSVWFPIGSQYLPTMYHTRLSRLLSLKDIVVTTLTFSQKGHVTSSITWPLYSWFAVWIGGPLKLSLYLASLLRHYVSNT